jgi:hypothetical protein
MKNRILRSLCVVGIVLMGFAAAPSTRPASPASKPVKGSAERAMKKEIPEVKLQKVKLTSAIDFVRDVTGANIFVNWRVLDEAGVNKDATLSVMVTHKSAGEVLGLILAGMGAKEKLAYDITDIETVVVSTEKQLDENVKQVVYDVRWILKRKGDNNAAREQLVSAIETAIAPETWSGHGRGRGSIHFISGNMIVSNSNRVHRQIPPLLEQLRKAPAKK